MESRSGQSNESDKLMRIEKAFESCFSSLETNEDSDNLITQSEIEKSKQLLNDSDYSDIASYQNAIEMVTTLLSTFQIRTVGGIDPNQQYLIRRVYRFVSGPLRECANTIDTNGEESVTDIQLDRIKAEKEEIEFSLIDCRLIENTMKHEP